MEKTFHLTEQGAIYNARHLVTHLLFLLSAFFGYVLFYRLFRNHWLACLGFLLLVLNPRIYAHSFFNSKDIPFLSMVMISLFVCHLAFTEKKTKWYVLLGAVCGYTASIRILGILPPAIFGLLFCIDIITAFMKKDRPLAILKQFALFIVSFCGIIILFWPTLWRNPVHNFIECYGFMSHFRWVGDVLFNGNIYPSTNIPSQYLPEWFCISNPILWLLFGFIGVLLALVALIKNPRSGIENTNLRFYLVCVGLFLLPVLMVLFLHSVVYDDWRHIYFIYCPFVVLILFAINKLSVGKMKWLIAPLCLLQAGVITVFMVKNHPFQSVYMNEFVSHDKEYIRKHFEMDYWGCSHKQALEYILAHDPSTSIKVDMFPALDNNIVTLPEQDKKRITRVEHPEDADYFVTNFRTHPAKYDYKNIFYNLTVQNSSILRVYKLR
jgi:hypothetical protein